VEEIEMHARVIKSVQIISGAVSSIDVKLNLSKSVKRKETHTLVQTIQCNNAETLFIAN